VLRRDRDELARIEFAETKIGKLVHKVEKLDVAAGVPGMEMLKTDATSGTHGLTVTEYAPYGVVGIVTPVTHSIPTLACNAIMIIAAGNALICNPHPSGAKWCGRGDAAFQPRDCREDRHRQSDLHRREPDD